MNNTSLIIMLIASFALAVIVIIKREEIPERARRPLAIASLVLVVASFSLFIVSIYRM